MSDDPTVLVLGGGVAGLVAARRLAEQGEAVAIWEASDRLGGQVCSVDLEEALLELGAAKVPDVPGPVRDLLTELGLWDTLRPLGLERFRLHDEQGVRLLPDGLTPQGLTSVWPVVRSATLGWRLKWRAAWEPFMTRRGTQDDDVSVATFMTRRFGHRVTERLIAPVTWGIVGSRPQEQSLRGFAPAMWELWRSGRSLVLQSLGARPQAPTMLGMEGGWRRLVEALAADVPVTLDRRAERLSRSPDGGFVVEGGGHRVVVRGVVLALPDCEAVTLLGGVCAPPPRPDLPSTENPGTVLGVVEIDAGLPAAWGADYVLQVPTAGSRVRMANVVWRDPDSTRVLLRVVGVVPTTDAAAEAQTLQDMVAYAERLAGSPVRLVSVTQLRRSVAREVVGHHAWVTALRAAAPPGIALAGSYYDGGGLNAVIGSGAGAAAQVGSTLGQTASA